MAEGSKEIQNHGTKVFHSLYYSTLGIVCKYWSINRRDYILTCHFIIPIVVSNLLFVESPAGVGWSYSNTSADYNCGDASTGNMITIHIDTKFFFCFLYRSN